MDAHRLSTFCGSLALALVAGCATGAHGDDTDKAACREAATRCYGEALIQQCVKGAWSDWTDCRLHQEVCAEQNEVAICYSRDSETTNASTGDTGTGTGPDADAGTDTGTGPENTSDKTDSETLTAVTTDSAGDTGPDTTTDTTGDTGTDTGTDTTVVDANWIAIPAGEAWLGSPDGTCPADYPETDCPEEPGRYGNEELHFVRLTTPFELMRAEVTQSAFQSLMKWNPSYFGPGGTFGACGVSCPVESVSWFDAVAYANELSVSVGRAPCYALSNVACEDGTSAGANYRACMSQARKGIKSATVALLGVANSYACEGYRLPTEAEWEYAVRASTLTALYSGDITNLKSNPLDKNLDTIGWYAGNAHATTISYPCGGWYLGATTCGPQPIVGKAANDWSLYDLSGNVSEWVSDWFADDYPEGNTVTPVIDPMGPSSGTKRVSRGGSWYGGARYCRSANRGSELPGQRDGDLGFRLARSLL